MNIEESIETYGEEFTKKVIGMAIIESGNKIGFIFSRTNLMYEDYVAAKMFTRRRKSVTTVLSTIALRIDYCNPKKGITVRFTWEVRSISSDVLYRLIFTEKELVELGYMKKFEQ